MLNEFDDQIKFNLQLDKTITKSASENVVSAHKRYKEMEINLEKFLTTSSENTASKVDNTGTGTINSKFYK